VGTWDSSETVFGIKYHPHVKILGITFWSSIAQSMNDSWARLTGSIRLQVKKAYYRDLCLAHRVRYAHTYLLAKLWYTAQIFPAHSTYIQRLTTAVTWNIWKGAIFRVPVSTLQRQKKMGGWELLDIEAKYKALFLGRMHRQSTRVGTATAAWLQTWDLTGPHANPPHATKFPKNLAYIYLFAIEMAYIQPQRKEESSKTFRKRLYHTLHAMAIAAKEARGFRIKLLHPFNDWPKVWHNLHTAPITEEMKSV
jgi:hypothetical protein